MLTKASIVIEEIKELLDILELEYSTQEELTKEHEQLETILKGSYILQTNVEEDLDKIESKVNRFIIVCKEIDVCSNTSYKDQIAIVLERFQNVIANQEDDIGHSLHLCYCDWQDVVVEQVQRTSLNTTKQVAKVDAREGSQLFIEVSINN